MLALYAIATRSRAQLASGAIAAQYFLNERETDAKHVGKGALGAQPPLVCGHDFCRKSLE
jgi:hypothetical protein